MGDSRDDAPRDLTSATPRRGYEPARSEAQGPARSARGTAAGRACCRSSRMMRGAARPRCGRIPKKPKTTLGAAIRDGGFLKVTPRTTATATTSCTSGTRRRSTHNSSGRLAINIMASDGSISESTVERRGRFSHLFVGLSREEARKVVAEFSPAACSKLRVRTGTASAQRPQQWAIVEPLPERPVVRKGDGRANSAAANSAGGEQENRDGIGDWFRWHRSPDDLAFLPGWLGVPPVRSSPFPQRRHVPPVRSLSFLGGWALPAVPSGSLRPFRQPVPADLPRWQPPAVPMFVRACNQAPFT